MIYNEEYYNEDFIKKLEEEFGSVEILDNGVIKAGRSNGDICYVNTAIIPEETTLVNVGCGDVNVVNTYQYRTTVERFESANPPAYSITIPARSADSDNAGLRALEVFESSNNPVLRVLPDAFSGSGGAMLNNVEDMLKAHPNAPIDTIVLNDTDLWRLSNDTDLSFIKKNNIKVVVNLPVDGNGNPSNVDAGISHTVQVLADQGIDVLAVTSQTGDHDTLFRMSQGEGGITDCAVSGDFSGYDKFYQYVDGELVEIDNPFNDFQLYEDEEDEETEGSLSIIDSNIKKKYSYLKEVNDAFINYNPNQKIITSGANNGNVSCNIEFITYSLNKIKSQIRSSGFLGSLSQFKGATGVLGMIENYMTSYFDMVGSLVSSLNQEIDAITSYGQYFVDMDTYISSEAARMSDSSTETPKEDVVIPSDGGYQGSTGGSSLNGSGDTYTAEEDTYVDTDEDITREEFEEIDDSQDSLDEETIVYDDNTEVQKQSLDLGNNSFLYFSNSNDNISDVTYRIDFSNNQEVLDRLSEIEGESIVDSVIIDGNYMNIKLTDESVAGKTIDEIKNMLEGLMI